MRRLIPISVAIAAAMCSCAGGEDGSAPRTVSVAYLSTLYEGYAMPLGEELYIAGQVVSSGEHGNFYKELVVADASGGITLKLDNKDVWRKYPQWSAVSVRLAGLVLGSYGGKLEIGAPSSDPKYQTQYLASDKISRHISVTSGATAKPVVIATAVKNLKPADIGTYRLVKNLKYDPASPVNSTAEAVWNGNRCFRDQAGDSIIVRTSQYADFKSLPISRETVSLEGVVGYFNGVYQLVLISAD